MKNLKWLLIPIFLLLVHKNLSAQNKKTGNKSAEASYYLNRAAIYNDKGQIDSALYYYKMAIHIQKEIGDNKGLGYSYNNIAYIFDNLGDIETAIEYWTKSLDINTKINYKEGMAISYENFGRAYDLEGDPEKALHYYLKSIEIFKMSGNKKKEADVLNLLGKICWNAKKYEQAYKYYSKSQKINNQIGDKAGIANSYLKIAGIENIRNNLVLAEEDSKKALKIYLKLNQKKGIISAHLKLAAIYNTAKNYSSALKHANIAYLISNKLSYLLQINQSASQLKQIYINLKNYKKAFEYSKIERSIHDSLVNERNYKFLLKSGSKFTYQKQLLKKDDEIAEQKIKQIAKVKERNIILIAFIFVSLLFIFSIGLILKNRKSKLLLITQKADINEKNQKITLINRSLSNQQQIINQQNSRLRKKINELGKFSLAIEQSPITIMITDIDANIEYANPHFTELTGYSLEEVIGKNPRVFKSNKTDSEIYSDLWKTILSGKIWRGEFINIKKNNEEFYEKTTIAPVKNRDNKITNFIAIKEDITDLKKAKQELEKAKNKAEKANMLKSFFLANMSHEIRTPMNAIIGFSGILQKRLNDESLKSFVDKIINNGNSLLKLINDILDISKIEAGQLQIQKTAANPRLIFNEVLQLFTEMAYKKAIPIYLNIDEKLPKLLNIDSLRIRQVLINLVSNALKFTSKGYITINVNILNTLAQENKINLHIEVIDTGIGINKKEAELIFQNFHQVEGQSTKKYGGTGLGLSITKKLVEMLDGAIKLKSTIGKGSKFIVDLYNIEVPEVEIESNIENDNLDIIFDNAKILYVEDNSDNREIVAFYFERKNIEMQEAENGYKALELLDTYIPDLILMDIQMPGLNGYETAKIIRKNKKISSIPIIALTANATREEIEKYSSVFDKYLTKPVEESVLIKTISQYLKYKKIEVNEIADNTIKQKDFMKELLQQKDFSTDLQKAIKTELKPIQEELLGVLSFDKLNNFVKTVKNIGEKFEVLSLITYSEELLASIKNFDIQKINKSLANFEKISYIITKNK